MTVSFNEAGMNALFKEPAGPTGRYLFRVGEQMADDAHLNASGRPGPNIRSGNLRDNIKGPADTGILHDSDGIYVVVGTDAKRDGFAYPRRIERGGTVLTRRGLKKYKYPFLIPALENNGFRRGR